MTDYRNREELKKAINEGYFDVNSYEKINSKGLLIEKILNMAKNDKDDIFKQLELLAEEVIADEGEISKSVDVDSFIEKTKTDEEMKSSVLEKLPMTTLAIKKLDAENIESLKWLLVKKLEGFFDKGKIFDLNDNEFKKMLCSLLRGLEDQPLIDNEENFTDKSIEDNNVEALVESFIKYAGKAIRALSEEESGYTLTKEVEDENNYYYLVKKQLDTLGEQKLKDGIEQAYNSISYDSVEKDPIDMADEVPESIKDKVQLAYMKDVIVNDRPDEEDGESDGFDTNEDEEYAELAESDEKLDEETISVEDQLGRQEKLTEELKQLYIIKRTKDQIMLESSSVLKDINYKKKLLKRTLMYEEAVGNNRNKQYCEKLMKVNTLIECLVRKYLPVILEQ